MPDYPTIVSDPRFWTVCTKQMDGSLSKIGDAPKRREDLRFVTGRGRYLDDMAFENLAHAVVLRSPHAHARIGRIDAAAARAAPGVSAVL
ncbi:MAG: hypothetical protein WAV02_08315, partial [Stellaceae bacterium]